MSEVHVKEGESLDSALKRFKRSCAKAGVLAEVRKRECYESPSVKRRKKSEAARKNRIQRLSLTASRAARCRCGRAGRPARRFRLVSRRARREMTRAACYPARGVLYSCQREWIR